MVQQTSSSLLPPAKREEVDHRAAPIQRICKQTCSPTTTTQSAHYLPILSPAPDLIGRIICLSNLTSLHAVDDRKLVPITSSHDSTRPTPTHIINLAIPPPTTMRRLGTSPSFNTTIKTWLVHRPSFWVSVFCQLCLGVAVAAFVSTFAQQAFKGVAKRWNIVIIVGLTVGVVSLKRP